MDVENGLLKDKISTWSKKQRFESSEPIKEIADDREIYHSSTTHTDSHNKKQSNKQKIKIRTSNEGEKIKNLKKSDAGNTDIDCSVDDADVE